MACTGAAVSSVMSYLYIASFPGAEGGGERAPGTQLFAHACNYRKVHVVELGVYTNMMDQRLSREEHKPSQKILQLFFLGRYKHRCYMLCLVLYRQMQREMSGRQ